MAAGGASMPSGTTRTLDRHGCNAWLASKYGCDVAITLAARASTACSNGR
jgi:hypothetical protein